MEKLSTSTVDGSDRPIDGSAAILLTAIQNRGSDAVTLRDAAHEACHALQWDVTDPWTRDNIHARKPKLRAICVRDEILARAVEQLVCRRFSIDCGSVEHWAMICWMETLKNERISLPHGDWLATQIMKAMGSTKVLKLADRVVALGRTS